ncbi:MAG: DUF4058 family protein [Planctomycetes bacterium]|nr:DUF4058 family protein [Planctomycetota bacterium]
MPLLDHFHPPLSERRPWESFHATWASALADSLNQEALPAGYIALEQVRSGAALEINVAAPSESGATASSEGGGTATATRTVWTPALAPMLLPAAFPPHCTIEIVASEGGRTLVAALEIVSPGNKDRPATRRQFAAKCATYLSRGIGLIVLDVVSSRQANLHNEMIELLGLDSAFAMAGSPKIYAVAYRPLQEAGVGRMETWPHPLSVGQSLPTLPLSLAADLCVALDLEAAYAEACQRRRLDEV